MQTDDEEDITTGDDDIEDLGETADNGTKDAGPTIYGGHPIKDVPEISESLPDESQFEKPIASPSVTGEQDPFSGDSPDGEPADIDEELKKVGLASDEDGVKPLSSDDIDY